MNTPNPLQPQGMLPQRGNSSFYFKVLMIVSLHVIVIGGLLMAGCKDTKTAAKSPSADDPGLASANPMSNGSDLSSLPPSTGPASAPAIPPANNTGIATPPPATGIAGGLGSLPAATPNVPPPITPVAPPSNPTAKDYTIASGDTLAVIAKKNGVKLKALEDANPGVNPTKLQIGQKLQIPASGSTPATAISAAAPTDAAPTASGDSLTYVVKSGDVLSRIATAHGTTYKKLMALNDLKTTSIKVGQKLKVPVMKVASASTTSTTAHDLPPATTPSTSAPASTGMPTTTAVQ